MNIGIEGDHPGGVRTGEELRQEQKDALGLLLGREGSLQAELSRPTDPEKLRKAIQRFEAVAIGLPTVKISETFVICEKDVDGNWAERKITVPCITNKELMQIFMSPDWKADLGGAGYYARIALAQALGGSGREETIERMEKSRFTKEEAEDVVKKMGEQWGIEESDNDAFVAKVEEVQRWFKGEVGSDVDIFRVLVEEAPRYKGQLMLWRAFTDHQRAVGDEKTMSGTFVDSNHAAPQGPDFQAFFDDGTMARDRAMRQMYAAGLKFKELDNDSHRHWLIEGIHYRKAEQGDREMVNLERVGRVVVLDKNVYASGWNTETFEAWMASLLEATNHDLLAAYDAWHVAITTGLVAKVATSGVTVGDPPIVASLHAWLMHFKEKQLNEAGKDLQGKRVKLQTYKGKTGPLEGVDKYPDSWLKCFFENATYKKDGEETSVFKEWWDNGVSLANVGWLATEQVEEGVEEEVRLSSFDGWLYQQFQLYKLLGMVQGELKLRDIVGYEAWHGMARSLDKAFGVVYLPVGTDKQKEIAQEKWMANGGTEEALGRRRVMVKDGVRFVQVVPDEENPRITLFKAILARYKPSTKASEEGVDTPVDMEERFTVRSELSMKTAVLRDVYSLTVPGVPIEKFIVAMVDSGMLTSAETWAAVSKVYGEKTKATILKNSERLQNIT